MYFLKIFDPLISSISLKKLNCGKVWNCFDDGNYYGQALFFDREKVQYMR